MANKVIVLIDNSPEIRNEIKQAGIGLCICASFNESIWLDFNLDSEAINRVVHGLGYPIEGVERGGELGFIKNDWEKHGTEVVYCTTVEEFIDKILKNKEDKS